MQKFSNPSGMITETVIRRLGWKKCIGLCNVPVTAMKKEPETIGTTSEKLNYLFAGINHFHWHKVINERGEDVTQEIISHINDKENGTPKNILQVDFPLELLKSTGLLPCGYHRYYFMKNEMLEHMIEEFKNHETRAEKVKAIEDKLFEMFEVLTAYRGGRFLQSLSNDLRPSFCTFRARLACKLCACRLKFGIH